MADEIQRNGQPVPRLPSGTRERVEPFTGLEEWLARRPALTCDNFGALAKVNGKAIADGLADLLRKGHEEGDATERT